MGGRGEGGFGAVPRRWSGTVEVQDEDAGAGTNWMAAIDSGRESTGRCGGGGEIEEEDLARSSVTALIGSTRAHTVRRQQSTALPGSFFPRCLTTTGHGPQPGSRLLAHRGSWYALTTTSPRTTITQPVTSNPAQCILQSSKLAISSTNPRKHVPRSHLIAHTFFPRYSYNHSPSGLPSTTILQAKPDVFRRPQCHRPSRRP